MWDLMEIKSHCLKYSDPKVLQWSFLNHRDSYILLKNPEIRKLDTLNYKLSREYFGEKVICVVMITQGQISGVKLPYFITTANSIKQKPNLQPRDHTTKSFLSYGNIHYQRKLLVS